MKDFVEVIFYICCFYLLVGCVRQANVTDPATDGMVKACVWIIMVGATLQMLIGALELLTVGSMLVSCVLSIGLGSFFLLADKRGRKHQRNHHFRAYKGL